MKCKLFLLLFAPILCSAQNGGFLWRVESDPPAYLFGTVSQIPYHKLWRFILPEAKVALNKSDKVYTESDSSDPDFAKNLALCILDAPKDANLSQNLRTKLGQYFTEEELHQNPTFLYFKLQSKLAAIQSESNRGFTWT